jgi:hypothetical protein
MMYSGVSGTDACGYYCRLPDTSTNGHILLAESDFRQGMPHDAHKREINGIKTVFLRWWCHVSQRRKNGTLPYFRRFYPRAEALRARDATEEAGNREASHFS